MVGLRSCAWDVTPKMVTVNTFGMFLSCSIATYGAVLSAPVREWRTASDFNFLNLSSRLMQGFDCFTQLWHMAIARV